jgi:DNA-binding transcriptional LysR family regulator
VGNFSLIKVIQAMLGKMTQGFCQLRLDYQIPRYVRFPVVIKEQTTGISLEQRLAVMANKLMLKLRHAETIVKNWAHARLEIALGEQGLLSIAIGCPFDLLGILLRDWAARLRHSTPELGLQIEVQPSDVLVTQLVNDLMDLALLLEPPQTPNLAIQPVAEIPLILVSNRNELCLQEAMQNNYYMVDWGSVSAQSHAEHYPDITSPAARLASGTLTREMTLDSGGTAYLAEQMVLQDLKQGRLYPIADVPLIERNAFVVYRPGQETRGEIRQALDLLRRVASR